MSLFESRVFENVIKLRRSHTELRCILIQQHVLTERENFGHKDIWGKCHVMTGRDWTDASVGQGTPRITSKL